MNDKLERKWIGARIGYVATAVLCYFVTLFVVSQFGSELDQVQVWGALQWLIGAIGLAVIGDTARPSGSKTSSFNVLSNSTGSSTTS